ncbi:MAG: biosynthetic-type acetolactate synthase large subunit [Lachnospiraceae bacterium]|nr:biosynthetic-type acetolactate synthase large subunit [Lachnospiraceae bacterium]
MNGAELLVKSLLDEKISYVFGYPGVSICPFFDALIESPIKSILLRNEQDCGHAASGYARVNNTVGVCAVSSGPGATNLITAIATAFADSIPLVCITGQVPTEHIGSDMFQEADIIGSAESFVKYSYLVRDAKELPRIVKEAFYIASTGRKGPVLIDLPIDIQMTEGLSYTPVPDVSLRTYKPTVKGHAVQIKKVLSVLENAKRPILCVGGGVILSGAEEEVIKFAESLHIPVVSTMMGIGVIPSDNPLYMGMVGKFGKKYANRAMNESDVLIMIGARVADRAVSQPDLITKDKVLVHIDVDPAEIGKNAGPNIPIVGDAKAVFEELNKSLPDKDFSEWLDQLTRYSKTREMRMQGTAKYVDPNEFVRILSDKLDDNAVYVSDVGQNQIYSCNNYIVKHGKFLTSGGMGTMGYSLPAAIGASVADLNRQIVCVIGDGAMQMVLSELSSAKYLNANIKIFVMNNRCLGMIREFQHMHYDNRYTMVDLQHLPDYEQIAKAFDLQYVRIRKNEETVSVLDGILSLNGPVLAEVDVDADAFTAN